MPVNSSRPLAHVFKHVFLLAKCDVLVPCADLQVDVQVREMALL